MKPASSGGNVRDNVCVTKLQLVLILFLIILFGYVARDDVRDQVATGFGFVSDYLGRWHVTMCVTNCNWFRFCFRLFG